MSAQTSSRTAAPRPTAHARAAARALAGLAPAALLVVACAGEHASPLSPREGPLTATAAAGVPSAPTNVVAVAGNRSATVRWSRSSDNGYPVRAYRVLIEPYGNWFVVEPADTQAVIPNLTNGQSWKFKVLATNHAGHSSLSAYSNSVVPSASATRKGVPGAPTAVSAVAGDAQATVRWTAPASTGGSPIQSYRVTVTPGARVVTVAAPATTAAITGLTNGTAYTFTAAAVNQSGAGPASTPSAPVTPTAAVATPVAPVPSTSSRWLMGYYVGYQRGLYPETAVDFSIMTHIVVGRILPTADGSVLTHFDVDNVQGPQMARTLATRAHAAGRKAILMLGGMGTHAEFVGAASDANRARFVANLIRVADELGYDGIDVDWEPIEVADRAPLLALLRAIRAARPGLLLTVPVHYGNVNLPHEIGPWYGELAAAVDRVNVMSYDMAGAWPGWVTWHHAALTDEAPNRPTSIASTANMYVGAGVPAAKLGIGVGFYGSCWRGVTAPRQAIPSNVSMGNSDNSMSYATIMSQYFQSGARQWDAAAQVPYLSFATPRGPQSCNFVSYEDAQSVAAKGSYVRTRGLGGAIVWTINQGRLSSPENGSYDPLLRSLYSAMVP